MISDMSKYGFMKKRLSFLTVALVASLSSTVNAQIWCSPGSLWHFDTSSPAFNTTSTKQTYLYDTLVGSTTFNKIKTETQGEGVSGPIHHEGYFYTSLQNNVVFFNSSNSAIPLAVDTFMYFGPVGSKWRVQPTGTSCSHSFIEITAVGSSTIQGQFLNWRKLAYTNYVYYGATQQSVINGIDTLFERIGFKHIAFQFLGYCADMSEPRTAKFKCFQDNDINMNVTNKECDYTTGIKEMSRESSLFVVYPNPATGMITVSVNKKLDSPVTLEITNVFGQVIYSEGTDNQTISLDIAELSNGIYFIKITGDKMFSVKKIIKE